MYLKKKNQFIKPDIPPPKVGQINPYDPMVTRNLSFLKINNWNFFAFSTNSELPTYLSFNQRPNRLD